jgi:hypothetical protein
MGLGTGHVTVASHGTGKFSPTIWSKELVVARENNLVLAKLVTRSDHEVLEYGEALKVLSLSNLTATAKAASTQVSFQSPTESVVTIDIDQYFESSFLIEDNIARQAAYNLAEEYGAKAGYALAEKMDLDIATKMVAGFTLTAVGTYGTALTYAVVRSAKLALDVAKVPANGRAFCVTAKGHDDLLGIAEFTQFQLNSNKDNKNAFNTGEVGYILGVTVYMSTNLIVTAGSPDQNKNLMFHKDAYRLAVQKSPKIEKGRIIEYVADAYVGTALWGGKVVRGDHGILVKS